MISIKAMMHPQNDWWISQSFPVCRRYNWSTLSRLRLCSTWPRMSAFQHETSKRNQVMTWKREQTRIRDVPSSVKQPMEKVYPGLHAAAQCTRYVCGRRRADARQSECNSVVPGCRVLCPTWRQARRSDPAASVMVAHHHSSQAAPLHHTDPKRQHTTTGIYRK